MQKVLIIKTVEEEAMKTVLQHVWGVKTKKSLEKWYESEHSPIYTQRFILLCIAEKSVMEQLRTHEKNGCQFYCDSGRPDTGNNKDGNTRSSSRHFAIDCNSKNLMDMARKRLCFNAEDPTRKFMNLIKENMKLIDYDLSKRLLVKCVLDAEGCKEFKSCGFTPRKELVIA